MGIFLAFFVVVSLVCLILLIKIKLKQRRSQVSERTHTHTHTHTQSCAANLVVTYNSVPFKILFSLTPNLYPNFNLNPKT
jgi:hypothetical protein